MFDAKIRPSRYDEGCERESPNSLNLSNSGDDKSDESNDDGSGDDFPAARFE